MNRASVEGWAVSFSTALGRDPIGGSRESWIDSGGLLALGISPRSCGGIDSSFAEV